MITSVLIPALGRQEGFEKLVESIKKTAHTEIEFLVGTQKDDPTQYSLPNIRYYDIGSSVKVHELAKMATGDMILMASTDEVFLTDGWDEILYSRFPDDKLAVLYTRDDKTEHHGSCRPIISKEWYKVAGYYPHHFYHFYGDTWVTDIAKDVGRLIYVKEVVIDHRNGKHGKGVRDEFYERRGKIQTEIWDKTLHERKKLAEKVRAAIG